MDIKFLKFLIFLILGIGSISITYAEANQESVSDNRKAEIYAKKLINSCESRYEKKERNSTADMIDGIGETTECLENEIIKMKNILFDDPEKKKEFEIYLTNLRDGSYGVYRMAFLNHEKCHPCGTMYNVLYREYYTDHLETLLKTMIQIAYDNQLIFLEK